MADKAQVMAETMETPNTKVFRRKHLDVCLMLEDSPNPSLSNIIGMAPVNYFGMADV